MSLPFPVYCTHCLATSYSTACTQNVAHNFQPQPQSLAAPQTGSPRRSQFIQYLRNADISIVDEDVVTLVIRHYGFPLPYPSSDAQKKQAWAVSEYNAFNNTFRTPTIKAFQLAGITSISRSRIYSEHAVFYTAIDGLKPVFLKVHNKKAEMKLESTVLNILSSKYSAVFIHGACKTVEIPALSKMVIAKRVSALILPCLTPVAQSLPLDLIASDACFGSLVSALNAVNSLGYSFLDWKPSNFVIDSNAIIRLIDFGSVRPHGMQTTAVTPRYVPRDRIESTQQTGSEFDLLPSPSIYVVKASISLDRLILAAALLELSGVCLDSSNYQSMSCSEMLQLCSTIENADLKQKISNLLNAPSIDCECLHCLNNTKKCVCEVCTILEEMTLE